MPVIHDDIIEAFRQYLQLTKKIDSARELLSPHIQALREAFKGQNFKRSETMDVFKSNLRIAMQPDHEDWQDIWTRGSALRGRPELNNEETELWNKRESIRSNVNRKAREIIKKVFKVAASEDPEDAKASSSAVQASSGGSSSSAPPPVGLANTRPKRSEKPRTISIVVEAKARPKKKSRRNPYDGYIQLSDFKPLLLRGTQDPKAEHVTTAKRLANELAAVLGHFGSDADELYIDGECNGVTVRFLGLKPEYIENIAFRGISDVVAPAPPAATETPVVILANS